MSCVCVDRGCVCVCVISVSNALCCVLYFSLEIKKPFIPVSIPDCSKLLRKIFFSQIAYICLLVARIFVQFNCSMVNYLEAGIENCLRTYGVCARISIRTVGYWFRLQHIFLNCATFVFILTDSMSVYSLSGPKIIQNPPTN